MSSHHSSSTPAGSAHSPKLEPVRSGSSSSSAIVERREARSRAPRVVPPWIGLGRADDAADDAADDGDEISEDRLHLLHPPTPAVAPAHNGVPSEPLRRRSRDGFVDLSVDPLANRTLEAPPRRLPRFVARRTLAERGRKWDHLRSAEPVIVSSHLQKQGRTGSKAGSARARAQARTWGDFMDTSAAPGRRHGPATAAIDPEVLDKLQPHFGHPVDMGPAPDQDQRRRRGGRVRAAVKATTGAVLRGSFAQPLFRLAIIVTSAVSLSLGCHLRQARHGQPAPQRSQALFGLIVDVLAIPYTGYMLHDEWSGKPLGLRSPIVKTSLILLDLFFIIFKSAGTGLVFETVALQGHTAGWRASDTGQSFGLMAGFMLLGLICWTLTFVANVFRTVEKLGGGEDEASRPWV